MTHLDPIDHILRMRRLHKVLLIAGPVAAVAAFALGLVIAPGTIGLPLALGLGTYGVIFAAVLGLARVWTAQAKAAFGPR